MQQPLERDRPQWPRQVPVESHLAPAAAPLPDAEETRLTLRLVAIALAGLATAAAAAALLTAQGLASEGLTAAAGILLVTGAGVLLAIRRTGAGSSEVAARGGTGWLEALPHAAAVTDRAALPVASNSAYRRLFGLTPPAALAPAGVQRLEADGKPFAVHRAAWAGRTLWSFLPAEDANDAVAGGAGLEAVAAGLGALEIGFAFADAQGRLLMLNEQLSAWLGVGAVDEVPALTARLLCDAGRGELNTGGGGTLVKSVFALPEGGCCVFVRRPVPVAGRTDAQLLEALFDAAPVGLALVDADGRLLEFNKAFRSFAPNRNPHRGDAVALYVAPEERDEVANRLAEVFAGETTAAPLDVAFNTQPPRSGQIFVSCAEHRDPPAAVLHLIDTTQHKSLERQFVQAQKMQAVGQLAGGVAHDFNNLLTAIIGFCDLLLVRHGPGDQSFSDVMQIKQNANRAANLVRQLLAFSRQQTLRPKVLIVTDVLAELSNLLRRLIGETIELQMVHGRDLGAVKVDQGQLEQVIINLAVNARDAMPDGGALTIRTRAVGPDDKQVRSYSVMPPGDYVLIEVADTGSGIPPENLNKIFEPFFTTKEVGKGTGLGLSTVYGIVKQTGGFIFVESEPGEGALFRVYLPVHDAEAETAEERPSAPKDLTGKGTILIVEDEDAVRMFASRALANKGYSVLEAPSGEEALKILDSHDGRIDLLISDVVMPNMDGPTLVAKARQARPGMRIIFISGYAEDVFRKSLGRGDGDFAFLPKPFSLKKLAETVKETLSS